MAKSVVVNGMGRTDEPRKAPVPAERIFVPVDMTDEQILQFDRDGKNMFWDEQNMRELDGKTVGLLSDLTAAHYQVALELRQGEKPSMMQKDVGRPWKATNGFATQQVAIPLSDKMSYKNARADKVQAYLNRGWTYADAKDAPKRKTIEGHVGWKERSTEFVLLKRPKELAEPEKEYLRAKRKRKLEGLRLNAVDEIRKAGYKAVDPLNDNEEV